MPTYLYETVPTGPQDTPRHYEIQQSMNDDALTRQPETGEPIRRVILGGYGLIDKSKSSTQAGSCGCGPSGCC